MLSSRADAHARIIMCAARVVMGPLGFSSPRFAQKRTTGTTVPRSSQFNNSGHWKKDQGVHESRKRNQHKVHVSTNATGVPRVARLQLSRRCRLGGDRSCFPVTVQRELISTRIAVSALAMEWNKTNLTQWWKRLCYKLLPFLTTTASEV